MYKKLLLASAIAGLVGCGGSDSSSNGDETGGVDPSGTAAVISGSTDIDLYYKGGDTTDSLSIVDPDAGEEAFIAQSDVPTTYGVFTITTEGDWTFEVPENEILGDMDSDESVEDSVDVESVDGTTKTLTFTILSADANPGDGEDPGDGDDDGEEPDPVFACADPTSVDSDDANPVIGGEVYTIDADDLSSTIETIGAAGGAEIIITSGDSISLKDVCFESPVLIRAASIGGVTLESASVNRSQNIILQGFEFGPNDSSTLIKVADSRNIKVLRNKFDHTGIEDGQTSLVIANASESVTVAYNEFLDKDIVVADADGNINSGSYIKFQVDELDDGTITMSKESHIHHNYFKNIVAYVEDGSSTPVGDTDREAIVFGDQESQNIDTYHVIEYNLFEDCDGENEIMTVKTSNNTFNNNTFLNSMGSLSFRLGDDNKAIDNYFYGTGASTLVTDPNYQTGGIRLYGENHVVTGNYLQDLTGEDWRNPILIDSGDTTDTSNSNGHEVASNVTVTDNILVNNVGGGIHIGGDFHELTGEKAYGKMPFDITITNNVVMGATGNLFNNFAAVHSDTTNNQWSGNSAYATSGAAVENGGAVLTSDELLILTSEPTIEAPTPLLPADVGTLANLP